MKAYIASVGGPFPVPDRQRGTRLIGLHVVD